jgi:26S proteasome regulatory subunit T2
VLLNNRDNHVVGVLGDEADPLVQVMKVEKAPAESYADIGGLDKQITEIKEAVELPLTHPELYEDIGIKPPKGVILYGEPGTGKTLLAKAVANSTSASFLRVTGSELIQKYLGTFIVRLGTGLFRAHQCLNFRHLIKDPFGQHIRST